VQFSRIRFLGCTRIRAGQNRCQFVPCLLWPAGRLAHTIPVQHVRDEFPFRASCFRRDLPHVVGFPHRRVLRSIRLPLRMRWAFPLPVLLHLPVMRSASTVRFQHRSVSGFPLVCPNSCIPFFDTSRSQERLGPPKFFHVSLPACHGLRTPADLPLLAKAEVRVLPSGALKPSASAIAMSKLYQHFRVRDHPCGLQDTLSTLRPSCSPRVPSRLRHGRKTRYGWVATPYPTGTFTLQETPSLLGAITPGIRRGWKLNCPREDMTMVYSPFGNVVLVIVFGGPKGGRWPDLGDNGCSMDPCRFQGRF